MTIDWADVAVKLLVGFVMGGGGVALSAGTWLVTTVLRLRRDMDAAFMKIRNLEGKGCNEQSD